jgi:hypothetical protein
MDCLPKETGEHVEGGMFGRSITISVLAEIGSHFSNITSCEVRHGPPKDLSFCLPVIC